MAHGSHAPGTTHSPPAEMASSADCSDKDLLQQFIQRRDESAFAQLVRRHGPMVLGVCRRILVHAHDAEDAFQAVFMILVRKAASLRDPKLLANWLYRSEERRVGKECRS